MLQKKKIVGTDLISLFGELFYKDHLYVGRELWLKTDIGTPEYEVTHEEWNKIVITYIRTGVMFYTIVGHPEQEFYALIGSMKVMKMKVAELDPYKELDTTVFILRQVRFDDKFTSIINFDNSDVEIYVPEMELYI